MGGLGDQTSDVQIIYKKSVNYCFFCFSALSSFSQSEDESKLFLPKLPTLPKR